MKHLTKSIFLSTLFSSPLFALNIPINQMIIGGSYTHVPVILTSLDSKIWNVPKVANLPENASTYLMAIHCNDARACTIIGSYEILPAPTLGDRGGVLFLDSKDGGLHWAFKKVHSKSGTLSSMSCQDEQYCVATGVAGGFVGGWRPAVLQTSNGGDSWVDVKSVPGTGGNSGNSAKASACNSKACTVVGEYINSFESGHALLFTTNDKGKHWTQNEIANPPSDDNLISLSLSKVNCNESMCFATGYYSVKDDSSVVGIASHDMIVVGNATATKWSRVTNIDLTDWTLRTNHCDENRCLILGENKGDLASLYTSDNGQTWETLKNFNNLPKFDGGFLNAISCLSNHCVAVGEYAKDKLHHPMIGISEDDGKHWEFNTEIDTRITPSGYTTLSNIQCTEQSCVATGRDTNGVFMLYSYDKGQHWYYSNAFPDLINDNLYFTAQGSSKATVHS